MIHEIVLIVGILFLLDLFLFIVFLVWAVLADCNAWDISFPEDMVMFLILYPWVWTVDWVPNFYTCHVRHLFSYRKYKHTKRSKNPDKLYF